MRKSGEREENERKGWRKNDGRREVTAHTDTPRRSERKTLKKNKGEGRHFEKSSKETTNTCPMVPCKAGHNSMLQNTARETN